MSPDDLGATAHRHLSPIAGHGTPTEVRARGGGGTMTCVGHPGMARTVRRRPGGAVTLRDLAR
jgi:hypothetical protein